MISTRSITPHHAHLKRVKPLHSVLSQADEYADAVYLWQWAFYLRGPGRRI